MRVLTSLRLRGVRYELRFTIFIMKVLTLHYDEPFESHGIMAYSIPPFTLFITADIIQGCSQAHKACNNSIVRQINMSQTVVQMLSRPLS